MDVPEQGRTGLVVAGAGARGAYEAGVLRELLPSLAPQEQPRVLVGTSAGALNVVGLAGALAGGLVPALDALVALWSGVEPGDVVDPAGTAVGGLGWLGGVAGLPTRLLSLLDTTPQRETLERLLPVQAVHDAVDAGLVDAVAVVTTSVATGGTVVFVERGPGVALPPYDPDRDVTYVDTRLQVEHVLASAAVPVAFRPVRVTEPAEWAGWYVDGGLRLNVPLKPALDLGADRLAVVSTQPAVRRPARPGPVGRSPDVAGVSALALRSLLADRMVEDLHVLSTVNRLVAAGGGGGAGGYREVPFRFGGPAPEQADDLARLATRVLHERYGGWRALRSPAFALLERALGGAGDESGELLSFLFFDGAYTGAAAALGREHGRAAGGWATDASA